MRKITQMAINAFMNVQEFKMSNTRVVVLPDVTILSLFGNEIAYRFNDADNTISITNADYFTNTTKERLNGIPGVNIQQRKGNWYLNGNLWDGKWINI